MGNRVQLNVRVPPEFKEQLEDFAIEYYGSKYRMGEVVVDGVNEFMDNDRVSRIEGKLDDVLMDQGGDARENGQKRKNENSTENLSATTRNRVRAIAFDLNDSPGATVTTQQVHEAIENHAGTSKPTLRRYKELLESRDVIFPTPRKPKEKWFTDPEQWTVYIDQQTHQGSIPEKFRETFIDQRGRDWWVEHTSYDWPEEYETESDPSFQ